MKASLLQKLLAKGHEVSIKGGILVIKPGGDRPVPNTWMEENKDTLVTEVLHAVGIDALRYVDFSTGNFSSGRAPGVRLVFEHWITGVPAQVFFNASITRSRSSAAGKKGARLPGRQFRPKRGSKFIQFWRRTGLPEPRYSSEFHESMGRLRTIVFLGNCGESGKIEKDSLAPLSISVDEIRSALLGCGTSSGAHRVVNGRPAGRIREQGSGSDQVNIQYLCGLQSKSPAAVFGANQVISIAGGETIPLPKTTPLANGQDVPGVREGFQSLPLDPLAQTTEEWLSDYESATVVHDGPVGNE